MHCISSATRVVEIKVEVPGILNATIIHSLCVLPHRSLLHNYPKKHVFGREIWRFGGSIERPSNIIIITVHAKTLRKSANIFVELRADFTSPIFILHLLKISCG